MPPALPGRPGPRRYDREMADALALLDFVCPRCSSVVAERFYGPCSSCREQLGVAISGEAKVLETGRFVPKMNVVPNQIASKD
jgi:hypothetical protein